MAISCQKCGRQYDATLFEFGRTIDCACGGRVGFEHRIDLSRNEEMKFFADVNVARLARWLRAAGFVCVWEDAIADADLVRRAIVERRAVLTLDKRLVSVWRADNILLLRGERAIEQFAEVVAHFKLKSPAPERFFTRCLVCNQILRGATESEIVAANVPAAVREREKEFRFCSHCSRVYWEGSHARRMRARIEEVFSR